MSIGVSANPSSPLPVKVALVGAGGFLGTNLALHLAPRVSELRCFGRSKSFPQTMRGLNWITGDLSQRANGALMEAISGCDTVIHLASTSNPSSADYDIRADAESNVISSLNLFDHCIAAGVGRVVFLSSGGTVYGIPNKVPTPESAPTIPITSYGVAKLTVEKYLYIYQKVHGLDFRILRVANPYGPFQTSAKNQGVVAAFLGRALQNKPLEVWGDGQVVRDYVYVTDVADAVLTVLAGHQSSHVFNIGSGLGMNLLEIIRKIEICLGRRLTLQFRCGRPVDVPVSVLDCTLAKAELGWQAHTSFEDGLILAAEWLSENRFC